MALVLSFLLLSSSLFVSPSLADLSIDCPKVDSGETSEDCPYAGVARLLIEEGKTGESVLPKLTELLPSIVSQLDVNSNNEIYKSAWGESINYDELAKGIIVEPAILNALAQALKVIPPNGKTVHAGMEHTYGYLFSVLKTPYGFKRARWVKDDIESGFALVRGTLGPSPDQGTLFSNVTYFIARIAFRDNAKAMTKIMFASEKVAQRIKAIDFKKLQIRRLEEIVDLENRKISIRTDFVDFPKKRETGNSALLIYSYYDSSLKTPKLISAFPVDAAFVARAVDSNGLGPNKPISVRYNASIPGLTNSDHQLMGTRRTWP